MLGADLGRTALLFAVCLGLCACAVQGVAGHSETAHSSLPETAATRSVAGFGRHEEPAHADGTEPSLVASGESESAPRYRLELPVRANFLSEPLPPGDASRYESWRQRRRIWVGQSHLQYVGLLDEGRLLLVRSTAEGSVRVYARDTGRLIAKHDFGLEEFETAALAPWPGGVPRFLLSKERGLDLHDARTGAIIKRLGAGAAEARWSTDRSVLVARSGAAPDQPSELRFYQRQEGPELRSLGRLQFDERVDGWDLNRDNNLLALSYYPSGDVVVLDLGTGRQLFRTHGPQFAGALSFSPDGRMLAVGGKGLLLIDLINPKRKAFHSYFYNNIDTVLFSPSSDALAASSYDGHLRIFAYGDEGPTLSLIKVLRHQGRANVYAFEFEKDGNGLVSASGDQTVRIFGGTMPKTLSERRRFQSLEALAEKFPEAVGALSQLPVVSMKNGHYHPPELDQPARPARLQPGTYACKVSDIYKLRDCKVTKDAKGHTLLEFDKDNLVGLKGVVYDDGPVLRYVAWQTAPSVLDCKGCQQQPVYGVLRGNGRNYRGILKFRSYYDPYVLPEIPSADFKQEEADDRFALTLQFRRALAPKSDPEGVLYTPDP